jgi:DNA integrity scanning protein DisA with diadenylate cyclase activity
MFNELNWKRILTVAGLLGVLSGIVPMFFTPDLLLSTLPVAMMFSIYFIVQKTESRRLVHGIVGSVLAAVISYVVYFIYVYSVMSAADATAALKTALVSLPMLVVIISVFGSFIFTKTHEWAEKKRLELEAKQAAKKQAEQKYALKTDKPYVPHATKKKYRNTKKRKK